MKNQDVPAFEGEDPQDISNTLPPKTSKEDKFRAESKLLQMKLFELQQQIDETIKVSDLLVVDQVLNVRFFQKKTVGEVIFNFSELAKGVFALEEALLKAVKKDQISGT